MAMGIPCSGHTQLHCPYLSIVVPPQKREECIVYLVATSSPQYRLGWGSHCKLLSCITVLRSGVFMPASSITMVVANEQPDL